MLIYNEKSELLGEIPKVYTNSATKLIEIADKLYFYSEYNEDEGSTLFEITSSGAGIVAMSNNGGNAAAISPNCLSHEQIATVLLPTEAADGGRLVVYDLAGRMLFTSEFGQGARTVEIAGSRLSDGMNVVNVVTTTGDVVATGKVLCK